MESRNILVDPPFLTSALDGGKWSALRPGRFTSKEAILVPAVYIGKLVSPRVCLDAVV
jgi:hypothetical protein